MSKQKTVYFSGTGSWFHHLFAVDEYEDKKFWSVTLHPDAKSLALAKDLGMFKPPRKLREDDKGIYMVLKRNLIKPWALKKGENEEFEPVKILNEEGKDWGEDERRIGNGTKITCKVTIYPTRKTFGARLETVRIDEIVEYVPPEELEAKTDTADSFIPF